MKKIHWAMNLWMMLWCVPSNIQAYQINLSFDSLFPMTWYQKGLEASMHVWQALINVFEKKSDGAMLSCDLLLGRLAFAQFCINRMHCEERPCLADDSAYFSAVLNKVKQLITLIAITPKTHDFVLCAEEMIEAMEKSFDTFLQEQKHSG